MNTFIKFKWVVVSIPIFRSVRIVIICCSLLLCMACGMTGEPSAGTLHRIALITPAGTGELAEAIQLGAEAAAKELGAELVTVVAFDNGSVSRTRDGSGAGLLLRKNVKDPQWMNLTQREREQAQVDAAAQALQQGATALLVDPLSEETLSNILHLAQTKSPTGNIAPVIVLNDEFPVKGITSVISMDNLEAGRKAGHAMADLLETKGRVAILGPDLMNPGLVHREQGVKEALAEYADIEIVPYSVCSNREVCWQTTKQLMDQSQVDGIITLQESASLGAADELNRRKRSGSIKLVGFGSEQQQLEQLQEGVIQQLIVQNGFSAGYLGVNQAVARLNSNHVEPRVTLETKLVSTDNMFWMDNQKLLFPFVQ